MRNSTWNLAHLTALCLDGTGSTGGGGDGGTGTGDSGGSSGAGAGSGTQGTGANAGAGTGTTNTNTSGDASTATVSRAEYDVLQTKLAAATKKQEDADKAAAKAARDAAEEQGNFKKLFEDADKELQASKPEAERAQKYAKAILAQVTKMMEGVPDYVQSLLKDKDPLEQMEWLTENADKLKGVGGGSSSSTQGAGAGTSGGGSTQGATRGSGTNPGAAGNMSQEERIAAERQALLKSGDYGSVRG